MNAPQKLALAVALSILAASPAMAAAGPSMTSSVGDLQFSVIDLTPDDGNAAHYRLSEQSASAINYLINYGPAGYSDIYSYGPLVNLPFSNAFSRSPFSASLVSNGQAGDARSELTWRNDDAIPGGVTRLSNTYGFQTKVTVSAGTAILVSGHVEQHFNATGINPRDDALSQITANLWPWIIRTTPLRHST